MKTVHVALGSRSYDICIGENLLNNAGTALAPYLRGKAPVVITDENVAVSQLPRLRAAFDGGIREIILPAGEGTKSWAQLEALTNRLLELGVERNDAIIALGGGVIGGLVLPHRFSNADVISSRYPQVCSRR
jgi:3-dehydroquinate synthase